MGSSDSKEEKKPEQIKEKSSQHKENANNQTNKKNHTQSTTTTVQQPKHKYKKGILLGQGTSGKVYECIDLNTKQHYAMKIITLTSKTKAQAALEIQNLKREIGLLKKLSHKNIVKYVSFGVSQDLQSVQIVLEKVTPGNLKDLVKKKPLSEEEAAMMCKQILHALKYLHGQGIVHRDLKGANILINQEGVPKISDFGTAKVIGQKGVEDNIAAKSRSLKGTPYWMAPEVLKRTGHTFSADIWSLGCTLIEMLTGNPPWSGLSNKFQEIINYIASGIQPPFPPKISKTCQKFLNCCLDTTPTKRLTAQELLRHPFIREPCTEDSLEEIDIQELQSLKPPSGYRQGNRMRTQQKDEQIIPRKTKQPLTAKNSTNEPETVPRKRVQSKVIKEKEVRASSGHLDFIDTKLSRKERQEREQQERAKEQQRREKLKQWQEQLRIEAKKQAATK